MENQTETVTTKTSINTNDNDQHTEKENIEFFLYTFASGFCFCFHSVLARFYFIIRAQLCYSMFTKFINLNFKKLLNAMQMER